MKDGILISKPDNTNLDLITEPNVEVISEVYYPRVYSKEI